MISLPIRNISGAEVGTYEFDETDLANGINKQLLHDVVVMYEANRRVGTVQTKSRGMVKGSTRKLYRQKGTGRARAGARRTPVRRGGGHAFAKRTKDWGFRLPQKAVRLATRMALLSKFQDGQATILDEISVDAPKTKTVVNVLKALGLDGVNCLLAVDGPHGDLWKSARNIATLQMLQATDLNAYALLHQRQFIVTAAAMDRLLGKNSDGNGEDAESE